jgi:hypothetical protein
MQEPLFEPLQKYFKKQGCLGNLNKMIVHDSHFHILHETDKFILGYVFEDAYLINKKNNKEIYLGAFYGDPACGLISKNNDWCLVCGDTTTTWKKDGNIYNIDDKEIMWVVEVRQTSICEVELLVDPWSEEGAIWKLNIDTLEKHKIKNFTIDGERIGKLNC